MTNTRPRCEWCKTPFSSKRHGSPQRFCSSKCRAAFWSALRRWGEEALASGALYVTDLRNGCRKACTLRTFEGSPIPLPEIGVSPFAAESVLSATSKALVLRIPITREGIISLVRLGWLDKRLANYPSDVTDAVLELANAALELRLSRP